MLQHEAGAGAAETAGLYRAARVVRARRWPGRVQGAGAGWGGRVGLSCEGTFLCMCCVPALRRPASARSSPAAPGANERHLRATRNRAAIAGRPSPPAARASRCRPPWPATADPRPLGARAPLASLFASLRRTLRRLAASTGCVQAASNRLYQREAPSLGDSGDDADDSLAVDAVGRPGLESGSGDHGAALPALRL